MKEIDEGFKMRNLTLGKSFKNQQNNLKLKNQRILPDLQALSNKNAKI
jgi:hypothetical protein